jgi:allophanate hydrolase
MNLHEEAMHPVTRRIIGAGKSFSAIDAFKAQYRLRALKRASERIWEEVDVLLTPTAGTIYKVAQVDADPIRLNTTLGYYTNFMNLLDLTGVAIPAGFRSDGLPFGVTLVGRNGTDYALLALADRLHHACVKRLGAMDWDIPAPWQSPPTVAEGFLPVAVCGAHMDGLVLNSQLRERGGYLIRATQTTAHYRLFALPGGPPERPGLVRVQEGGAAIDVEVWAVRSADFGSLISNIPAPLGIGTVELRDGERVPGFLCESYAADGAVDITQFGGWRAYCAGSP